MTAISIPDTGRMQSAMFRAGLSEGESLVYESKHSLACGYAWGRQDMGCGEKNSQSALEFANEYAKQAILFAREERHMFPNPQSAYEDFFAGQQF